LVLEALQERGKTPEASYHLGLSLGEYSALYGAGAMSFENVMRALVVRGKAMQDACELAPSGMMSVLGMDEAQIETVCASVRQDGEILKAANLNAPGQIVVSGHLSAIERSLEPFKEAGARRAIPLKVAGAFHSPLMASAAATLKDCLEGLEIGEQCANVISNVTAKPHDPTSVKEALVQQITAPVRWSQSIENLIEKDGVESFYEWGTGKVLSGLIKRVSKSVSLKAVSSVEELEQI
jgi:[acyl-carrier-protein] S-malonyltransferase